MYRLNLLMFVVVAGCTSTQFYPPCDPVCQPPCVQLGMIPSYHACTPDMALNMPFRGLRPADPPPQLQPCPSPPRRLPPVNDPPLWLAPPVELNPPKEWIKPYDEAWGGMVVFSSKE